MHQFTSQTPPTRWPSMGAIWNNSLFLRLYESTSAPVHLLNTSHAWTIHVGNSKQLLVFRALRVGRRVHQSTSGTPGMRGWSTTRRGYRAPNGSKWLQMALNRYNWVQTSQQGTNWLQLPPNESKWPALDPKCSKWVKTDPNGSK